LISTAIWCTYSSDYLYIGFQDAMLYNSVDSTTLQNHRMNVMFQVTVIMTWWVLCTGHGSFQLELHARKETHIHFSNSWSHHFHSIC